MKTGTFTQSLDELETDLLVTTLFETDRPPRGVSGLVDWRLNGFLSRTMLEETVTGKLDEVVLVPLHRRLPARRLLIVGLGKPETYTLARARHTAFRVGRIIADLRPIDVCIAFPSAADEKNPSETERSVMDALNQAQLPSGLMVRWLAPQAVAFHEPAFLPLELHA